MTRTATAAEYDPGPHTAWNADELPTGIVLFDPANCTSFRKRLDFIATKPYHAAAYQEAKVPEADHARLRLALDKTHHRHAIFSNPCPEHSVTAAGVAAVVRQPMQAIRLKPRSRELKEVLCTGRIALTQFCLGAGIEFNHFNVYGWGGLHQNHTAAARTDCLFVAAQAECKKRKGAPAMSSGDVNADTEDTATLADMLKAEGWKDLGAHGHRWGARRSEATCWAPNSGLEGTRRDFIFINMELLPYVVGSGVCPLNELPTYAALQVLRRKSLDDYVGKKPAKPASLHKHLDTTLKYMQEEQIADGELPRQKKRFRKVGLQEGSPHAVAQQHGSLDHCERIPRRWSHPQIGHQRSMETYREVHRAWFH